jgi:hypothetical protein
MGGDTPLGNQTRFRSTAHRNTGIMSQREDKGMVARHRGAEEWLAELNSIMHEYRNSGPSRQRAVRRMIELGFSAGQAVHYLDRHSARPAVSHSPDGQPLGPHRS